METTIQFGKVFAQRIHAEWLQQNNVTLDVLRLDRLHDVVSGNKWFKLKYYLKDAKEKNFKTIATFGGAFSNHIIATAFACFKEGLSSIGVIRGEEPPVLSHTLQLSKSHGMQFEFVNRALYKDTTLIQNAFKDVYWISEGGYGHLGLLGAKEILQCAKQAENYSHIICAVGTGTMMAGIIDAANTNQNIVGISVMKGNHSLIQRVIELLPSPDKSKSFSIKHDFHFGGYAKYSQELIEFMNEIWQQYQLPTDIVYTAKTFYGTRQMIINHMIPSGARVLMIHSGGLQGNLSLPEKTLYF